MKNVNHQDRQSFMRAATPPEAFPFWLVAFIIAGHSRALREENRLWPLVNRSISLLSEEASPASRWPCVYQRICVWPSSQRDNWARATHAMLREVSRRHWERMIALNSISRIHWPPEPVCAMKRLYAPWWSRLPPQCAG